MAAILNILEECDIDGIIVVTADDLSSNPKKVLELMDAFSSKGVEVISIYDDLPDEKEYHPIKICRPRHCTVTIFEE